MKEPARSKLSTAWFPSLTQYLLPGLLVPILIGTENNKSVCEITHLKERKTTMVVKNTNYKIINLLL